MVRANVFDYIDVFYNRNRRHTHIGDISPERPSNNRPRREAGWCLNFRGSPLLPYLSQVLCGKRPVLRIFGNDYPTRDGTPIRDYLHPMDLADAHVLALDALFDSHGYAVANLSTGQGHSVLDVLAAYEAESGRRIPVAFAERRPGDASTCYADPSFAHSWLGWRAVRTLNQMCADAWRFQQRIAAPQPIPPVSTIATKVMPARAGMQ